MLTILSNMTDLGQDIGFRINVRELSLLRFAIPSQGL